MTKKTPGYRVKYTAEDTEGNHYTSERPYNEALKDLTEILTEEGILSAKLVDHMDNEPTLYQVQYQDLRSRPHLDQYTECEPYDEAKASEAWMRKISGMRVIAVMQASVVAALKNATEDGPAPEKLYRVKYKEHGTLGFNYTEAVDHPKAVQRAVLMGALNEVSSAVVVPANEYAHHPDSVPDAEFTGEHDVDAEVAGGLTAVDVAAAEKLREFSVPAEQFKSMVIHTDGGSTSDRQDRVQALEFAMQLAKIMDAGFKTTDVKVVQAAEVFLKFLRGNQA